MSLAARIAEHADQLHEADLARRRLRDVEERLHGQERDCRALERALADERKRLGRVRFGPRALWLAMLGRRGEQLREAQAAIERIERQQRTKRELIAGLEAERRTAAALVAAQPSRLALRDALEHESRALRAELEQEAPELADRLGALEGELIAARSALEAAERALLDVREIGRLLESARGQLERALKLAFFDSAIVSFIVLDWFKYARVRAATSELREARRLMDRVKALDPVRRDLPPLEPDVSASLEAFDMVFDSALAGLAVMTRIESSLDGVVEAEKLFADLEPTLARPAQLARAHADNLERRFRDALVAAATHGEPVGV